ncbi:AMP-binding protein [Actinomyces bouchesdurhonensis]|uniref:AMP-binding protein n=1 Tax=Actinomyces bouchesdurhonensis TaxID=1852361 RepID=UPI0023F046F6|nr:AMP-binding protein [Actinomyces bouchesdurhonensis]
MTRSIVEQAHDFYDAVPYEVPVPETSLYELLDTAARLYPDRVALDYFGATTTYEQVRDQVLRAARVLHEAGVRAGDTVAIALPNCPQAFVAFYACMRIGAVAAQHNPLAPAAQIDGQIMRHGGRVAIVWEKCVDAFPLDRLDTVFTVDISYGMPTSQRFLLKLPVPRARQMRAQLRGAVPAACVSWDRATASARPIDDDHPLPSPGDRAVILHTSGTNGVPKSAPLTHRNIGANVNQCIFWVWKLHEGAETFFSLLPYFHAFGLTFFLCAAVRKAATQVLLPKFDAQMALDAHKRRPVTFFVGVPPMFERILARAITSGTDISTIRYSVAGAMPLSTTLAEEWEATTGGTIVEGYGLSETAPVLTGAPLSDKRRHGVLGVPFPSTQLRLVSLEDDTRDVEDGTPGEIIVRGPQVFEGYLNAPEESARVFTSEGWFKTGDVGVNRDGFISMADRKKELILSGGFNVYPSQVEDAIRSLPGVADVAVVGVPVADATEEVTAAIIMEEGAQRLTLEQVREWAEKSIAHYALPRQIVFIAELPRNQMGKILRRKVAQIVRERIGR